MSATPNELLARLIRGRSLTRAEVLDLFGRLMDGELSDPLKAAILVALAAKGEVVAEIVGAAEAMRARVIRVPHSHDDLVDTCGTGGDSKGTFNLSTAAAIIAAGAGVRIAKHGNRSVSSRCGSADILAALGVRVESTPEQAAATLTSTGIAFLFAPGFHPAMQEVVSVRDELGVRTIFNLLGPLTNPAGANRQVLGVYSPELVETVGHVLRELGARHALVVHGHDGLDEITTCAPTRIAEVRPEGVTIYDLTPADVGVRQVEPGALAGGDAECNAKLMHEVLAGREEALLEASCVNAAAALYVAGRAPSIAEGAIAARQAVEDGRAAAKLLTMTGG
jgi:anthranilate phosphoribosyltransferase